MNNQVIVHRLGIPLAEWDTFVRRVHFHWPQVAAGWPLPTDATIADWVVEWQTRDVAQGERLRTVREAMECVAAHYLIGQNGPPVGWVSPLLTMDPHDAPLDHAADCRRDDEFPISLGVVDPCPHCRKLGRPGLCDHIEHGHCAGPVRHYQSKDGTRHHACVMHKPSATEQLAARVIR